MSNDVSTHTSTVSAAPTGDHELLALDATTLCEAFQVTARRFADQVALRTPGDAVQLSWRDYSERVKRLAGGLHAVGVRPGDTVATMLINRPEALLVDTAAMHLGAVPFAMYNTSSTEQLEHLLAHAASGVLVTEAQFLDRVLAVRAALPALREIVVVDEPRGGTRSLAELEAGGSAGFEFERTWRSVRPGDVATLIYTSGTTGPPKGVELTHDSLLATQRAVASVHPPRPQGRLISWLPLAHLADRVFAHYPSLISGATVTCVPDPRAVIEVLPEVRPTAFLAVPRVWEKLRAALEPALAGEQMRSQVAANLGLDQADLIVSGAAPIAREVLEFFAGVGIEIYEGWAMSETSSAGTLAPRGEHRVGTVGKPLPGVEVKTAVDGELLVRGPVLMRGYRNDPQQTAEAIDPDGWMHTGDIGEIDADGYVRIVDRKKELIINAAGKNMSPTNIENALKAASPLIGHAVAIGDRRPYNTALITLDADAAAAHAAANGIDPDRTSLANDAAVQALIAGAVERANARLSRVEQIKKHAILPQAWEPGGDELTETMKLKRKVIADKYAAQIEQLYTERTPAHHDRA